MKRNIVKRLSVWAFAVAAVLMIPFLTRAPWTKGDFIFAGTVLFTLATIYEVVTGKMAERSHRIAVGVVLVMILIAIWGWAVA